MELTKEGYWTIGILLSAINSYVTLMLWRNPSFTSTQKAIQSAIIWLLPIVGAWAIYKFQDDDDQPRGPNKPPFGGGGVDGMPGGTQQVMKKSGTVTIF